MVAKVFVDGAVGTTGLQIEARLAGRRDIELVSLPEEFRKDSGARKDMLASVDIAILCLPDAAAVEAADMVAGTSTRLIDASTAHRTHPDWCFGFEELTAGQGAKIAAAKLVSNPGCYSIAAISLLRPLREAGVLGADHPVSIGGLSGYTGGGKSLIAEFEGEDAPVGFVYGTTQTHKHLPEIKAHGLLDRMPIFSPSVGSFAQGMIVQVPFHLDQLAGSPSRETLHASLKSFYAGSRNVEVAGLTDEPARLDPEMMNDTDKMRLFVLGSQGQGTVVLAAVLDNLGKGASGSAVQNLELMLGA